jgi:hypothetical protein
MLSGPKMNFSQLPLLFFFCRITSQIWRPK